MSKKRNIFFIIILASSSLLLNFFFDSAISKYHAVDEDVEVNNDCYAYGPEKETGLADDKYALNSTHKPDNNEDTK